MEKFKYSLISTPKSSGNYIYSLWLYTQRKEKLRNRKMKINILKIKEIEKELNRLELSENKNYHIYLKIEILYQKLNKLKNEQNRQT
jgi:hypothetical protein